MLNARHLVVGQRVSDYFGNLGRCRRCAWESLKELLCSTEAESICMTWNETVEVSVLLLSYCTLNQIYSIKSTNLLPLLPFDPFLST